jgi:hypothetical protein
MDHIVLRTAAALSFDPQKMGRFHGNTPTDDTPSRTKETKTRPPHSVVEISSVGPHKLSVAHASLQTGKSQRPRHCCIIP